MRRSLLICWLLSSVLLSLPLFAQQPARPDRQLEFNTVRFTPNRGQVADMSGKARPDILYTAQSGGVSLFLSARGVSYVFRQLVEPEGDHQTVGAHDHHNHIDGDPNATVNFHRMDMELVGANPRAVLQEELQEGYTNYYLGHCPDGITRVPSYGRLVYKDVYPGIDMVLRSSGAGIKCDFIVHPGGRVSDIQMRYIGAAERPMITEEGQLIAATPLGYVVEEAPVTFQHGGAHPVESSYRMMGDVIGFNVGDYDRSVDLVIDPTRLWATYFGGGGTDELSGGDPTEVDRSGNVIIGGATNSNNFPTSTGAFQTTAQGQGDCWVAKFNGLNGTRIWATYYGGTAEDRAHAVSSDTSRNVYMAGHANSNNFPVSTGAHQTTYAGGRDACMVKFDSTGTRLWATLYGRSNLDDGYGFGIDSTGNVVFVITTQNSSMSTDGSSQRGGYDVLVSKFTSAGARSWATYYGGTGTDYAWGVATDLTDNIIVTGWTNSSNGSSGQQYIATNGAHQTSLGGNYDAFLVKFNNSGSRQWSTYYGGNGNENEDPSSTLGDCGVATDSEGNIFITGSTAGGFSTTTGAFQTTYGGGNRDAFLVKFYPGGTRAWATYLGGSGVDIGNGLTANTVGGVLVTGYTASTNFPVTIDGFQTASAGSNDGYVMKFDSLGRRQWGTYYGGTASDEGVGVSFDPYGSLVVAGNTQSTNFPTLNPYQTNNAGQMDAWIALFCVLDRPAIDTSGPKTFCIGDSVVLSVPEGFASYLWYPNGERTNSITVKTAGRYSVRVTNAGGCSEYSDTAIVVVNAKPTPQIQPQINRLCEGDSVTLDAGPGYSAYLWSTGETSQRIKVKTAGRYNVLVTAPTGCSDSATALTITINPRPVVSIGPAGPHTICEGDSIRLTATGTGTSYLWSNGERGTSIAPKVSGTYSVTAYINDNCPVVSNQIVVKVNPKPRPQIFTSTAPILCEGDSVELIPTPGYRRYAWSTGDTAQRIWVKQTGTYTLTVIDTNGCVGSGESIVTVVPHPKPTIVPIGSKNFCEGDSVRLDAGAYTTYLWSTGETSRYIVVKEAGKYSVVVSELAGCFGASDTVAVTVNPRPSATIAGPVQVCVGSTVEYSVPKIPGVTYRWTVSGGNATGGDNTEQVTIRWGSNGTGTLRLVATNDSTGCTAQRTINVVVGANLSTAIATNRSPRLCAGDTVELDAGPGFDDYTWSTGEKTRKIKVTQPGQYYVNVAQTGGCSGKSDTIAVTINPDPVANVQVKGSTAICAGDSVELDAGPGFSRYVWSGGERTRVLKVGAAGTYTVEVTDANGCRATSEPITVTIQAPPTPTIDGQNSVCINGTGTYTATGSPGSTYVWTVSAGGTIMSGQGTNTITVQWTATGTERVDVVQTDATTGCEGPGQTFVVAIGTSLSPTINADGNTNLCEGDTVTLTAPPGYSQYTWSNGSTSQSIRVAAVGSYTVTVRDAGGCSGTSSPVEVTINPRPVATIIPTSPTYICPGDSIELQVSGNYTSYAWSGANVNSQAPSIYVKSAGRYRVVVTDANGCQSREAEIDVIVHTPPTVPVISTSGGDTLVSTPASTYQWMRDSVLIPGATSQRYVATVPGDYSVTITDANGCRATSAPMPAVFGASLVELPEIEAGPGERLKVPIILRNGRNLDNVGAHQYQMTLTFNKNLLMPTGSTPLGDVVDTIRRIVVTGMRAKGIESGEFGELEFVSALGDSGETVLHIERFEWLDGTIETGWRDGLVKIVPNGGWKLFLSNGRLRLEPVVPNPSSGGTTTIYYELIEPGQTSLAVFDVLGKKVLPLVDADMQPGVHRVTFDGGLLPSGNFFIVLQTPTTRLTQPFQIQR